MTTSLQHIIEERVRNAYAAGHNDARKGRWDRMDEVAKTETERILKAIQDEPARDMTLAYMLGRQDGEASVRLDGQPQEDDDVESHS